MISKKKKVFSSVLGGALVITLIQPGSLLADSQNKFQNNGSKFCSELTLVNKKFEDKFTDVSVAKNTKFAKTISDLGIKRTEKDKKMNLERSGSDQKRAEKFVNLESKATTDVQKQALVSFKLSVQTAVTARRGAVDQAIAAYRTGINSLLSNNATSVISIKGQLASSTEVLLEKVKAECAQGADSKAVRLEFKNGLSTIKNSFNSNIKNVEGVRSEINNLESTKKASFKKASDDYQTSFDNAKTAFLSAFRK